MPNENELQELENANFEYFDIEELEKKLEDDISISEEDIAFLEEEKENIGNPDKLGKVLGDVVMEQLRNQIATVSGDDFIKKNNGLTLDLRKEAHIQTTENFEKGKIATHNTKINYQKRYDDWQSNFVKDENGNVVTHKTRTGEEATLIKGAKGARKPFDDGRPSGSAEKHTDMDHTVAAAEIIRDPAANAHMTKKEQIAFANSDANLNEMDSSLNRSKGDKSMTEWLDNPNANGQKPDEIFDISAEDDAKLRQKDAEARKEYEKQKKAGEKKSIETGKKSQREEAFRIGRSAIKTVVMQLLTELIREIVSKLVAWIKSNSKKFETFVDSLKSAIKSFIKNLKDNVLNAADAVLTTVLSAIFGPVVSTIKKIWTLLKQGLKSLKEAIQYLKNPKNKGLSTTVLALEVAKIITAGAVATEAILLSELVEAGLRSIPVFDIEIPLLGSLANIIGIFMGGLIAGLTGALVMHFIDKAIAKKKKSEIVIEQINVKNGIIISQDHLISANEIITEKAKVKTAENVINRTIQLNQKFDELDNSYDNLVTNNEISFDVEDENKEKYEDMKKTLDSLF